MSTYLSELFSLAGKIALVTGGSKGIGLMISTALVKAGAKVYISSRSQESCDEVAKQLSEHGACVSLPFDLSTVDNIQLLADQLGEHEEKLDILINNSGRSWGAPIESFPEKGWDNVMTLNVKSPFYLVQKLLHLLTAAGTAEDPARIINIGSIAGISSLTQSAYSYMASKAAINHLTKGLAIDLVGRNITANAIAPGFFPSRMTRHITEDDKMMDYAMSMVPMGRMGKAEEIGSLAIYLCSKPSAYITGSVLTIDGGVLVNG